MTEARLTPAITIRAQGEDDMAALAAIRNNKLSRWGTLATPYESVGRWRKLREARTAGRTELVACAGGEVVGMAGLFRIAQARRAHVAGIGITIHDDFHGQGIGTKLFAALTDLADNWLNLSRLELDVYTDNPAAIALYQKFGFEIEATVTADAFRDGAFANGYIMGRVPKNLPRDTSPYPPPPPPAPAAPFTLRAAEPTDAPGITDLMLLPLVRHGTLRTPFTTVEENAHLAAPTDPTTRSILAIAESQVVGIAILTPGKNRRAHVGEVALLAVHDSWQNRGIGAALLAAVLDIADNWLNLTRLQLGVLSDNAAAIRLYEKFGFITEGTKRADVFRAGAYADTRLMARFVSR